MSFQLLTDATTREIIGLGPFDPGTDPGAGYAIETVADDALQPFALEDGATLDADNQGITTPTGDHRGLPPAQIEAEAAASVAPELAATDAANNPPPEAW